MGIVNKIINQLPKNCNNSLFLNCWLYIIIDVIFFYHLFQMIFNFNWINDVRATFWSGSMCLYKYRYSHDFECILGEISASKFFKEFTSADLSQIAREKWCDHLLIIYMQKCHLLFLFTQLPQLTVSAYKWQPRPGLAKILTGKCWW